MRGHQTTTVFRLFSLVMISDFRCCMLQPSQRSLYCHSPPAAATDRTRCALYCGRFRDAVGVCGSVGAFTGASRFVTFFFIDTGITQL